jgi:hypothetical protein
MCRSRDLRRGLVVWLAVLMLSLLGGGSAVAEPVDPAEVPADLRQYVPDSADWMSSPWMTGEPCRDQGGDWSLYAEFLIKDFPELLEFFQPDFAGTDGNAGERKKLLVRGYRDLAANLTVPTGYCVDQVRTWATRNPSYQPWGFEWGNVDTMGYARGRTAAPTIPTRSPRAGGSTWPATERSPNRRTNAARRGTPSPTTTCSA